MNNKLAIAAAMICITATGCSYSETEQTNLSETSVQTEMSTSVLEHTQSTLPSEIQITETTASSEETETLPETTMPTETSITTAEEAEEGSVIPLTLTFLGDCILSSNEGDIRPDTFMQYAETKPASYFFEKALPSYSESDLVVANSEFVLSDRDLPKIAKNGTAFWFKSPTSFTDIMKEGGIDAVTIANNHTGDYGEEGYKDTQTALDEAGIMWGDINNPIYCERNGIRIMIICAKLYDLNFDWLIDNAIADATTKSDIQIVYFHGGTEKQHVPEEWLIESCHNYVDAGADLVIGSHPHVLRPTERYNGVDIVYSLGNFCYGAHRMPENRTIIFNETFYFNENNAIIEREKNIIPFYVHGGVINNWQPCPVTDPRDMSRTLAFMHGGSLLPY